MVGVGRWASLHTAASEAQERKAEQADHGGSAGAYKFLACDRDQAFLLPPDLRDWLPADHLVWFVLDVIDHLELGPFLAAYRADGHGRAAYQPRMLLAVLLYAYCTGIRSSRQIERRCQEDIGFRIFATMPVGCRGVRRLFAACAVGRSL